LGDFDKVQVRMLMDWSEQPEDMIVEEELGTLQRVIESAVDGHYGNDTTLDLTTITHEGKLGEGISEEGWTVDDDTVWDRIPGDTHEEKLKWIQEHESD